MPVEERGSTLSNLGQEIERLKEAYLARVADRPLPASGCTSPEEIWAIHRGEADRSAARIALRHAIECPACSEAWRLARELETAQPLRGASRAGAWRWGGLAAAAVVVLGLLLVPWLLRLRGKVPPVFRETGRPAIEALVPENVPTPRTRVVLTWTAGPEGTLYDVELATENLDRVTVARGLERNEYRVPEDALRAIPRGGRLLWRVEALHPDGTKSVSRTFIVLLD